MPKMPHVYDRIGRGYTRTRRPDPRIAAAIEGALGDAARIVNVGAGTGAYAPTSRHVVAVEPSAMMIAQRGRPRTSAVQAVAEALPFADATFDAALAILTVHHWTDVAVGLGELRRVAPRRVVLLTWVPGAGEGFWLTRDYLPDILTRDTPRFPSLDRVAAALGPPSVTAVPIPADCTDGFLGAFWRRPEAYLDPAVRRAISVFPLLDPDRLGAGLRRLAEDLASGRWERRYGAVRTRETMDLGYRLIVATGWPAPAEDGGPAGPNGGRSSPARTPPGPSGRGPGRPGGRMP